MVFYISTNSCSPPRRYLPFADRKLPRREVSQLDLPAAEDFNGHAAILIFQVHYLLLNICPRTSEALAPGLF